MYVYLKNESIKTLIHTIGKVKYTRDGDDNFGIMKDTFICDIDLMDKKHNTVSVEFTERNGWWKSGWWLDGIYIL